MRSAADARFFVLHIVAHNLREIACANDDVLQRLAFAEKSRSKLCQSVWLLFPFHFTLMDAPPLSPDTRESPKLALGEISAQRPLSARKGALSTARVPHHPAHRTPKVPLR
jgi:hypothetical protein